MVGSILAPVRSEWAKGLTAGLFDLFGEGLIDFWKNKKNRQVEAELINYNI